METNQHDQLLARLSQLERSQRRMRYALGCLVLILFAMIGIGADKPDAAVLEAQEIVIKDKAGAERMKMSVDASGPFLQLFDSRGLARASLTVEDVGATLY